MKNFFKKYFMLYFIPTMLVICADANNNIAAITIDTLYHTNGNISEIRNLEEGKLNGYSYFFHPSGELKSKLYFVNDLQEDSSFTYHKNGRLRSSYLMEEGLVQGRCTIFYGNGDTMESGEFYNSMRAGLWTYFDSLGNKIQTLNGYTIN